LVTRPFDSRYFRVLEREAELILQSRLIWLNLVCPIKRHLIICHLCLVPMILMILEKESALCIGNTAVTFLFK
jgi:hypothetical protein